MVSAMIRPPSSRARADASSWRGMRSGSRASMVSRFQLIDRFAAAVIWASSSISSSVNLSRQPGTMPSMKVPSCCPTAVHSAISSSLPALRDATGLPSPSEWVFDRVVDKPNAARLDRLVQQRDDRLDLVVGRLPIRRLGSHHVAADRAVSDQEACIDRQLGLLDRREVVGEGLPTPPDTGLERLERHALDLLHHPAGVVGVLGAQRRKGEPAVAAEHRRHAVLVGRRDPRIPEQLRVVVGVVVDEARRDDQARWRRRSRSRPRRRRRRRDDPAVAHPDVSDVRRGSSAINDRRAFDEVVEHVQRQPFQRPSGDRS